MKKIVIIVLFATIVIISSIQYYKYIKHKDYREDLIFRTRVELEYLKKDKTMSFLELVDTKWEEECLILDYNSRLSPEVLKKLTAPSLLLEDFYSAMIVDVNRWSSILQNLNNANYGLCITYSSPNIEATCCLKSDTLCSLLEDSVRLEYGRELFALRKSKEIMEYARIHFNRDRYLTPLNVDLNKDFVTLLLSFDDSKFDIDISLRDTSHVASHYTDVVGEMGSLQDGLLSICVLAKRGFAIEYKGKYNRKKYRCEWPYEKAQILFKNRRINFDKSQTNQVHTVVRTTNNNKSH